MILNLEAISIINLKEFIMSRRQKANKWRNNDLKKDNDLSVESSYFKDSSKIKPKRLSTSPDYHNTYWSMVEAELQSNMVNVPYYSPKQTVDIKDLKLSKRKSLNFMSNSVRSWFDPMKEPSHVNKLTLASSQNKSASPIRKSTTVKSTKNKGEGLKNVSNKIGKHFDTSKKNLKKYWKFEDKTSSKLYKGDSKGKKLQTQ